MRLELSHKTRTAHDDRHKKNTAQTPTTKTAGTIPYNATSRIVGRASPVTLENVSERLKTCRNAWRGENAAFPLSRVVSFFLFVIKRDGTQPRENKSGDTSAPA